MIQPFKYYVKAYHTRDDSHPRIVAYFLADEDAKFFARTMNDEHSDWIYEYGETTNEKL